MFLLLLIVIAAGLYFLDKYSVNHALDGVSYDIKPNRMIVETDDEFILETTITNSKRLPVEFLRIGEFLPESIILSEGDFRVEEYQRGTALVSDTYLMPRQKLVRTFKAAFPRRGRYFLPGATLTAGSFLNLSKVSKEFHCVREIIIPPKPVETPEMKQLLGRFIGDISINRFIMEDPVLTIGFREYTDRDPMRSICWKQTARFGRLMIKNYDHTIDLTVTVILNIDTPASNSEEELETVFSLTRTVCDFLEASEIPYRLVTNVAIDGTNNTSIIPDGFGGEHLTSVLEFLGRATYNRFDSFTDMIAKIAQGAEPGRSHILLTPDVSRSASHFLRKIRARTGKDVLVITPETAKNSDADKLDAI